MFRANDRVVMSVIGAGGMGRGHMDNFKDQGVEWAAVADAYGVYQDAGLEIAGPRAKGHTDHRSVLDRKDIDAVPIATPEHWHHNHLVDAVLAGKDAYGEKPLAWSIEQGYRFYQESWVGSRWVRPEPVKEKLPGGMMQTVPLIKNFLECLRTRQQPNATIQVGHQAVRSLHLANIAYHKNARAVLGEDGKTVTG